MNSSILLARMLLVLGIALLHWSCEAGRAQKTDRPKLAVVIVVDQMRADHLSRLAGVYKHGFGRLLRQGAVFTEAHHDHAYTVTAVGHTAISTGTYPSRNGIVGNNWFDRIENRTVYCCEDPTYGLLGYPDADAVKGRSPLRMLVPTIGDWLKAQSPQSQVFAVSRKDRAAILSAGKNANGAYWYDSADGNLITSKYYSKSYRPWVKAFNASRIVDDYFQVSWSKVATEETYFLAREDTFGAENDGEKTAFPYELTTKSGKPDAEYYGALTETPFCDALILQFAKALVENENLGMDQAPDLLFISCSAADAIGHKFGPFSQESMDHFLRLDAYLGEFFAFLDRRIGENNYVAVLSSDHGVMPMPEELVRRGFDAKRLSGGTLFAQIKKAAVKVAKELGISQRLITGMSGYGLNVNYRAAEAKGVAPQQLDRKLIAELRKLPAIADVFAKEDLNGGTNGGREYQNGYAHSFYLDRSGDLTLRLKKYQLIHGSHGTTHGSPYRYDTHVPIVFCGATIQNGPHAQPVRTVDIAPTLAEILGIRPQMQVDGKSLYEIIARKGGGG